MPKLLIWAMGGGSGCLGQRQRRAQYNGVDCRTARTLVISKPPSSRREPQRCIKRKRGFIVGSDLKKEFARARLRGPLGGRENERARQTAAARRWQCCE